MSKRWGILGISALAVVVTGVLALGCQDPGLKSVGISLPSGIQEGENVDEGGVVSLPDKCGFDRVVSLSWTSSPADNEHRLKIPAGVTVPAGSEVGTFTVEVPDNNTPDVDIVITVTASFAPFQSSQDTILIVDDGDS